MKTRMNYRTANPAAFQAMLKLEQFGSVSGIEPSLKELIKIRVSQINGCSFCLDMHTTDSRKQGETEQRIYVLPAWREAPFYTDRERAALALAEAVTLVADQGVSQQVYEQALSQFTEAEYVALIMLINTINSWNRLAISTGMFPGCFDETN